MKKTGIDYSKVSSELKEHVEYLKKVSEMLYSLEESVVSTEREVNEIDASLPSDAGAGAVERRQLHKLYGLVDEAYALIDQILGPPDDEVTGEPEGTAFMPQARGNEAGEIDIDRILKEFGSGKNNSPS